MLLAMLNIITERMVQYIHQYLRENGIKSRLFHLIILYYIYKKIKRLLQRKHSQKLITMNNDISKLYPNYFVNDSGLWIYTHSWTIDTPKAICFIVHGFMEHIQRYEALARHLNALGISVYGIDHIGHGHSQGDSGYIYSMDEVISDYITYIRLIQTEISYQSHTIDQKFQTEVPTPMNLLKNFIFHSATNDSLEKYRKHCYTPKLPKHLKVFMFAHSMGGMIGSNVANFINNNPDHLTTQMGLHYGDSRGLWKFDGVVLSSPLMKANPKDDNAFTRNLVKFLNFILPKLETIPLSSEVSSRSEVRQRYLEDVLVRNTRLKARSGYELSKHLDLLKISIPYMTFPVLLIQGTNDKLVDKTGAKYFYDKCSCKDKSILFYENGYHELLLCRDYDKTVKDVLEWIKQRM
jgi:acylglycerol lipase